MPNTRSLCQLGRPLQLCTSSKTGELCAISPEYAVRLHHSVSSKVIIPMDSRAALLRLRNVTKATIFSRDFIHTRTFGNFGWYLHLQWIPLHVGFKRNVKAGNLDKAAHLDEATSILLSRSVEARLLIGGTLRLGQRDVRVTMIVLLPQVPRTAFF